MDPILQIITDVESKYKRQIDKLNRGNIQKLLDCQTSYYRVNLTINRLMYKKILEEATAKNISEDDIFTYIEEMYNTVINLNDFYLEYSKQMKEDSYFFENNFQKALKANITTHKKENIKNSNSLKTKDKRIIFEKIPLKMQNKEYCLNVIKFLPILFLVEIKDFKINISVDEFNSRIDKARKDEESYSKYLEKDKDYFLAQNLDILCYGNNTIDEFISNTSAKKQKIEQVREETPQDNNLYDVGDIDPATKSPQRNIDLLPKFDNINLTGQYLLNW